MGKRALPNITDSSDKVSNLPDSVIKINFCSEPNIGHNDPLELERVFQSYHRIGFQVHYIHLGCLSLLVEYFGFKPLWHPEDHYVLFDSMQQALLQKMRCRDCKISCWCICSNCETYDKHLRVCWKNYFASQGKQKVFCYSCFDKRLKNSKNPLALKSKSGKHLNYDEEEIPWEEDDIEE